MAEETSFGVHRLRQAITNQSTCVSQFELSIDSADKLCREIENELESLSWAEGIPAPVDADGNVVPLTTKVMYGDDGREYKGSSYRSFIWSRERGQWYFGIAEGSREVASLHLRRPDSWEKLEKDVSKTAGEDICGYFGIVLSEPCSAECPASGAHDSCAVTAVRDVMRRAKALAERDAKGADRD